MPRFYPLTFTPMRTSLGVLALLFAACPPPRKYEPPPSGRCDLDFEQFKFADVGKGVSVSSDARGTTLKNDRLQVRVDGPRPDLRGKPPFGGQLRLDSSTTVLLNYASGRTMKPAEHVVLQDGAAGGYAVIAATGADTVNDTFNLHREADGELPLLITTYFVVSPGESRVRVISAFCNEGKDPIETTVGDLLDIPSGEVFSPGACAAGFNARACPTDTARWLGVQAGNSAYAYRAYSLNDSRAPAPVTVERVGDGFMTSLGGFGVLPGDQRVFVRDVLLGADLAELTSAMLALDAAGRSRVTITTQFADETPAPNARVSVKRAETGEAVTIAISGDDGTARFDLPPGNYLVGTGAEGYAIEPFTTLTVPSNGTAEKTVKLGASRVLTVTNGGAASPRLIARCVNPPCAQQAADYRAFSATDDRPDDVQLTRQLPAATTDVRLPPGEYALEFSAGPRVTRALANVDLRSMAQTQPITIQRVVAPPAASFEADLITPWELGSFAGGSPGGASAWDWTGGAGPSLRLDELFTLMRPLGPITMATPRTTLAALQVDTATGQSHADAGSFRMAPADNLFSFDFDAMAVDSVAELNDWLTFLSNGHPKQAVHRDEQPLVTISARFDGGVFSAGETIAAPAGAQLEFSINVQAADWVQFDSVELHTDAPGRESLNGVANTTFVPASAQLTKTFNPTALPSDGGVVHLTEAFTVTVSGSTWFVALVRGTGASQPVDPLTGAKVFAVTNPIFVTSN